MRVFAILALVAALAGWSVAVPTIAATRHTPAPAATPLPPEDPVATKVARQQFVAWQIGSIDRTGYTDELSALASPDQVASTSKALLQLGSLQKPEWAGFRLVEGVPPGSKTYLYKMLCSLGSVFMQFSITKEGKLAGIIFRDNLTGT